MLCCLLPAAGAWSASGSLPAVVERALQAHGLPRDSLSVFIAADSDARPLLAFNADAPRNPASVMKLVTTFAALDLLGPGYRWRTGFLVDKPVVDGRLDGDLFVRGGGDPLILVEDFLKMLAALRQRGLARIDGDLVIDNRLFDSNAIDRKTLDGQSTRVYNAYPEATVVNFRATRFVLRPEPGGVRVFAEPPASNLEIVNRVAAVAGRCRGALGGVRHAVGVHGATTRVTFSGDYPTACGERSLTRSVLGAGDYLFGVFAALWSELGGSLGGSFRTAATPDAAREFHAHESRPLFDVLRGVNKHSNNLAARMLLLALGAEVHGAPGSPETGRAAIYEWLARRGVSMPGLVIDNGAGLSRAARVTARGLGALLGLVERHPFREEFLASLSLTGIDGSTKSRLDGLEPGRFRLKTGLLKGVRALAGFARGAKGDSLRIVVLQNHDAVGHEGGNAVQDAVLAWVDATL